MKKYTLGILAHVDAGKTTLAESLLHISGTIRKQGRVDHGDSFLDQGEMEKARGITIFSKQARLQWRDCAITLLDTPGHVDFSAEMERTLQVLDYALLVIDGSDGVQGDVHTLWQLLGRYHVPTFLFVNKMDQPGTEKEALLRELQTKLDSSILPVPCKENALDVQAIEAAGEELALCDEQMMEGYLETGHITVEQIQAAVCSRHLFPCFFGAALREEGVEQLLDGLDAMTQSPVFPAAFGARVYKIGRDPQGIRLTWLKITGGSLQVRGMVGNACSARGEEVWEEKINQIRLYNGSSYETAEQVQAGEVCAVAGLQHTFAGEGLGYEAQNAVPILEPVITYRLLLDPETDPVTALGQLRTLEEEQPELHVTWQEENREICVQVMGQVQMEILKNTLRERFGLQASFDTGSVVYKETLAEPVEGIGHFEPLRHYAEVRVVLEPGERGSGIQVASACSEDVLEGSWQRQILSLLEEKRFPGVLTGSELTDVRILLTGGRAHPKHTEGGDFRQAAWRAVRMGLRSGKNLLLEPWLSYRLEVPAETVGRAMADITRMHGSFEAPVTEGDRAILQGKVPAATMRDYGAEVTAYTHGHGSLSCVNEGYAPCHNTEEIMAACAYDPEADVENPTGSVFCAHGAGYYVPWNEVADHAHTESTWERDKNEREKGGVLSGASEGVLLPPRRERYTSRERFISQEEIEEIFRQSYRVDASSLNPFSRGQKWQRSAQKYHSFGAETAGENPSSENSLLENTPSGNTPSENTVAKSTLADDQYKNRKGNAEAGNQPPEEYLLVDGYNIIFAWPELRDLSRDNLEAARGKLMDILCDYQGYRGCHLILVYDAYKVKGNPGEVFQYHNICVVYTKEAQTADQYIERTVHEMREKMPKKGRYLITVATSDALEQMIVWGAGAVRISAMGLKSAIEQTRQDARDSGQIR